MKVTRMVAGVWARRDFIFSSVKREFASRGVKTGGFLRGVAFLNCYRYVGRSKIAKRKDRYFTSGIILVYDKR